MITGRAGWPIRCRSIEQITYLIFIKRLDGAQELEERKARTLDGLLERRIFPEDNNERGEAASASALNA